MKYGFVINATISLGVEVEASSLAEAIDKAQRADIMRLSSWENKPGEWSTSEIDCGDPGDCELVDYHGPEPVDFEKLQEIWNAAE